MPDKTQPGHRRPADAMIGAMYGAMLAGARLLATTAAGAQLYQTPAGRYFVLDAVGTIRPLTAVDAAALVAGADGTLQEGNMP